VPNAVVVVPVERARRLLRLEGAADVEVVALAAVVVLPDRSAPMDDLHS
jgi:hypothetical protein